MKRSAGDKDGPEQKRLATQQDGQAHRSATPLRTNYPQVPPSVPLSRVQKLQRIRAGSPIWSGTLEIPNGPHSNDQRQDVDIISGKINSFRRINTINWPKQLKMASISQIGYLKLWSLDTQTEPCIFSVDGDCDKKSLGAFIQYSSRLHMGCVALLEYTSSAIQVLRLISLLLQGEEFTVGFIMKFSNNDHTVKLLTDLGILPHATVYNKTSMAKKEREMDEMMKQVIEQRRALLQKDEALKEKEVELSLKEEELVARDSALLEKEGELIERDGAQLEKEEELTQRDRALSVIEGELREREIEHNWRRKKNSH